MQPTRMRWSVLVALFAFSVMTYLDRLAIGNVKTPLTEDLGLTNAQMGYVFSAFTLGYGIFEIPTGWLGDRFGPRSVLTHLVLWWSALTAITGVVSGYIWLLAVRFVFGGLQAGAFPNATCVIRSWFPADERGRAQGVVWMAASVGGGLAPFLIQPILRNYDWRMVFYIFSVFGLVWAVFWHRWFRDNPRQKSGVNAAELERIGPPNLGAPHGNFLRMLRSPNMWYIIAMYHISVYGSYWFIFWLPGYLVESKGLVDFAPYVAMPFLLSAVFNYLGGHTVDVLVKKIGLTWARRSVGLGAGVVSATCVLIAIGIEDVTRAMLLLTLGYSAIQFALPNSWAVCLDVGRDYVGSVSGAMNTAGQIGGTIASVAIGYAIDAYGWDAPLYGVAAVYFIGSLFWFGIDPHTPVIPVDSEREHPQPAGGVN
jgi:sugar phosphate permease